jgi:thiamine biosynthesis lipoprotein
LQRHVFAAMGTEVDCLLEAPSGREAAAALWAVEREFQRLEALLSRFLESSELSQLNREGTIVAGTDLFRVTELALAARAATGGRFDPTVQPALVAAGYDRTFEAVESDGGAATAPVPCGGAVHLDPRTREIVLGHGVSLDLGGIAKGYAVDRACDVLACSGPCLVNAGGDLAVRGLPELGVWPVALETACGTLTLGLSRGALATSGRDRRRWRRGGEEQHHLIDPTTGAPARTDLVRVTALAATAVEAEVMATALFVAGSARAAAEAEDQGVPCVLVTEDGSTLTVGVEA